MRKWKRQSSIKTKAEKVQMTATMQHRRLFWMTSMAPTSAADVRLHMVQGPYASLTISDTRIARGSFCGESWGTAAFSFLQKTVSCSHPVKRWKESCHAQIPGLATLKRWVAHKFFPWYAGLGHYCCQPLAWLRKQIGRPLCVSWNWISMK